MKNRFFILWTILLLISCSSIKKHNAQVSRPVSVEKLKKDVDFAYRKLQKMQPALYWYIPKEQLDYKFDSLKTTITKPLTSYEFYTKITPVLNEVRQGHLGIYPNTIIWSKEETRKLVKKGMGPFSQFEFMMFNNKLYVQKNNSIDSTIAVGSEIVSIDSVSTEKLLIQYRKLMTSDGYNTTFYKHQLPKKFSNFYVAQNGLKDSLLYAFKFDDTIKNIWIKRKKLEKELSIIKDSVAKKLTKAEKKNLVLANNKNRKYNSIHGYDASSKTFQRTLSFTGKDSSVAVLKIKSFSIGNYEPFYKESFKRIINNKSKYLVLDLRDNPGGRLSEINYLYSFVADSIIPFVDKSQVASKTSFLKRDYFTGSWTTKALKSLAYPFYVGYIYLKVKKEDDNFYFYTSENRTKALQENRFKGKMYVLIDGGSFSASSILSSNLKGSNRAVFVGEETGGAYNGTVAGQMPIIELPNSKVKIRVGLMRIAPHYKTDEEGHGIRPDIEIIPTLEDKIKGNDPEMNWILDNIKNNYQDAK
ncbi:S41 family peptidase [Flavobacterium sp. SM2513]|uniref:S41 family peptidase n=1 Tax=Flavobacterium sp. SM2513 TaxID=3424766 RepID=UPI003D7F5E1F